MKKIFVSGCYDMLHSGHVAFFEEAASHGDLYVGIGSDRTIRDLKGRPTIYSEKERLYMVKALKAVKEAWINSGSGLLDFKTEMEGLRPDILFVNEDGHTPEKENLCAEMGVEYLISRRLPSTGLPARSTTALRTECTIPYRIDLAGGWLDQPYVSQFCPGPVVTISIEPDYEFNDRSGMATSTRKKAIELWKTTLPDDVPEQLGRILFCFENPPGSAYVSGSQDALGIVMPGLAYLGYEAGQYWPSHIETCTDPQVLDWIGQRLYLLALQPRESGLSVTEGKQLSAEQASRLAEAANNLWNAAKAMDAHAFGESMIRSFNAQTAMFPNMLNDTVGQALQSLPTGVMGYKLSGAGGGGYLVLFSEQLIPNTLRIRIRKS